MTHATQWIDIRYPTINLVIGGTVEKQSQVNQDLMYITNDIIIGHGEVLAKRTHKGIVWALPGGGETDCRDTAIEYAKGMDRLIRANFKK